MTDNSIPGGADASAPTPPAEPATPAIPAYPGETPAAAYTPPAAAPAPTYAPPATTSAPGYAPPAASPASGYTPPAAGYPQQAPAAYPVQPAPGTAVAPSGYATAGYANPGYATPGHAAPGYAAPGYGAPGYGAPAYAPRPTNGVAIAALICGIAGFLLGWTGAFIIVPALIPVAAVVLGHIALSQLKKTPGVGGRGMAITGLILGYIPIGFAVLVLILGIIATVMFGAFTIPFIMSS